MKKIHKARSIKMYPGTFQTVSGLDLSLAIIAAIDQYFAEDHNFSPVFFDNNKGNYISLKQISKELYPALGDSPMEEQQIIRTLKYIGYEAKEVPVETLSSFKKQIQSNINQNHLTIVFFAKATGEFAGMPDVYNKNNECVGLIIGFNENTDELILSHGGNGYHTSLKVLFESCSSLKAGKSRKELETDMKLSEKDNVDGVALISVQMPELENIEDIRKDRFIKTILKSVEEELNQSFPMNFLPETVHKAFADARSNYIEAISHAINGSLSKLEENILAAEKIITSTFSKDWFAKISENIMRRVSKSILYSLLEELSYNSSIPHKKLHINTIKYLTEFKSEPLQKFLLPYYEIYIYSKTSIPSQSVKFPLNSNYAVNITLDNISADFFEKNIAPELGRLINKNKIQYHYLNIEQEEVEKLIKLTQREQKTDLPELQKWIPRSIKPTVPAISFEQSCFYSRYEKVLPESCIKYNTEHSGLCQPICLMIAEKGINDKEVKDFLRLGGNGYDFKQDTPEKFKESPIMSRLGDLCWQVNKIEKDFQSKLKQDISYLTVIPDEKNSLLLEEHGVRRVNIRVMKVIFDKMDKGQFFQLLIIRENELKHATLIFKTIENNNLLYCFYDPAYGLYKKPTVEELCFDIRSTLTEGDHLSVIDVNHFNSLVSEYQQNFKPTVNESTQVEEFNSLSSTALISKLGPYHSLLIKQVVVKTEERIMAMELS